MTEGCIPVAVKGVIPTPTGCGVLLGNADKTISIFVDQYVAAALTMYLNEVHTPRPLTHDLIVNILAGLDVSVTKVVINDLREGTFYGRVHLLQQNELGRNVVEVDARPSDAITLATQQQAPILVAAHVWEQSEDMSWALTQLSQQSDDEEENSDHI